VIFGDPDDGEAVGSIPSSKVLIIFHTGDHICLHGDLILEPHLTVSGFFGG
jgi:cutinase